MIVILCIEFDLFFVYSYTSKMVLRFVKDMTMLDIYCQVTVLFRKL